MFKTLLQSAAVNRSRKMSDETVEMDASISVYSENSECSPSNSRRLRRLDVAELLDLNCDVVSVDSMLVKCVNVYLQINTAITVTV